MKLRLQTYTDPKLFKAEVVPFMLEKEAENCLGVGIVDTLINIPERYPNFHLTAIKDESTSQVLGASWLTPPHPIGITDVPVGGLNLLLNFAWTLEVRPSGVAGPVASAERFKDKWLAASGAAVSAKIAQRIYEVKKIHPPSNSVDGELRLANDSDRTLLEQWNVAFAHECKLDYDQHKAKADTAHDLKYGARYIWEVDGKSTSMVGVGGETPNGIRVRWVYTPPLWRGKGFASAAVARVSQMQLDRGKTFCFLYTDLDNPTSNRIYQRMGYNEVCDAVHYSFSY